MKLSPRMLAMALAADAHRWGEAYTTDARKARLYLAQWLWDHPYGRAQKDTAMKLLDLPDLPSEDWSDLSSAPINQDYIRAKMDADIAALQKTTDSVRRMILLRRIGWWTRLLAVRIEKDLQDAIKAVENTEAKEPFYEHSVAAPGKDRKYVRWAGVRPQPNAENPA